ncbi:MAG: hypothetical protein U0271_01235 [Polyangiaceae bacterium]
MTTTAILRNVVAAALAAFVLVTGTRAFGDAVVVSRDGFTITNLELFPSFVFFTTSEDGKQIVVLEVDRPVLAADIIGGPPRVFLVERAVFDAWSHAEPRDSAALVQHAVLCGATSEYAESVGSVGFAGQPLGDDSANKSGEYGQAWDRLENYSVVEATPSKCTIAGGVVKPEAHRTRGGCAGCAVAPETGATASIVGFLGAAAVFARRSRKRREGPRS